AQEIGAWADTQEGGEVMHDALYKAYFVETKNIGVPDVLLEIVEANGLPVEDARKVLEERTFKDAVDEDWRKSRQYGITGVPTFVAAGHGIVGAQPYETLEKFLESAGATMLDASK
ncbi:MAG: DsbA family protein, partial [Pseudomonadota bacterium]|nr:DsbA family protein [Pseudomonadota bacterium]